MDLFGLKTAVNFSLESTMVYEGTTGAYERTYRRHIRLCKQKTAMLIALRENKLCKTSTRHRKNSKQSGIVAIDSCFALFGARQYGVTTRESSDKKISTHSDLSPDLELSTPPQKKNDKERNRNMRIRNAFE